MILELFLFLLEYDFSYKRNHFDQSDQSSFSLSATLRSCHVDDFLLFLLFEIILYSFFYYKVQFRFFRRIRRIEEVYLQINRKSKNTFVKLIFCWNWISIEEKGIFQSILQIFLFLLSTSKNFYSLRKTSHFFVSKNRML